MAGGTYGPDLIDRWKARAFQQDPSSETPCCGYEEEDTNWGGSSTLLGERVGPVRAIRETWGADSGTNVIRRETFYRREMDQKSWLRVHVIPPLDGIYAQWDFNAGRVERFYSSASRDKYFRIDGRNDEVFGNFDDPCNETYDANGTSDVDQAYREAYGSAPLLCTDQFPYHQSIDLPNLIKSEFNAAYQWNLVTGPNGSIPRTDGESDAVHRLAVRARALDSLRGLLPAATRSNVGIFGTAQGYEALLLRMGAHPSREVRDYAALMLVELQKVIPAFLKRLVRPERGGVWTEYLRATQQATRALAAEMLDGLEPEPREEVTLTDFDPDGEVKVVAAALYAVSALPDDQLLAIARKLSGDDRRRVLEAYVGARENRRHKPGRAFERTAYRFDVLGDYGAFRDLQRHRLLTLEWQPLSPRHGWVVGPEIAEAGAEAAFRRVMEESAALYHALADAGLPAVAPYAVAMAYRVRFYVEMNAREAMHVIELRTTPQGHPSYRRICQAMHRLIAEEARHPALAAAMRHADHSGGEAGRLSAERAAEARRARP